MEIAHIFALNKSDRQGADEIVTSLKNILHLRAVSEDKWDINVIKTIGVKGTGVKELLDEIFRHRQHLTETGLLRKKRIEHLKTEITELVNFGIQKSFWNESNKKLLEEMIEEIYTKDTDPYTFSEKLINSTFQ